MLRRRFVRSAPVCRLFIWRNGLPITGGGCSWEPKASGLSWQMSHRIGGAGGGYLWPDVSFSSDWESVLVSARRTEPSEVQPIRYLNDFSVRIPVGDFERGIDGFSGTIARLVETVGTQTDLSRLWHAVLDERRAGDLAR